MVLYPSAPVIVHKKGRFSGDTPVPYTGRFFKPLFSLCPCPHDAPPCVCGVSPAGVPAVYAASAAWPEATGERQESALATSPAIRPPVAIPPLARLTRAHTAFRASHIHVSASVLLGSR